jgi:hypothetical protein
MDNASDVYGNMTSDIELVDYFSIELDTFLNIGELEFQKLNIFPNPVRSGENIYLELKNIESVDIIIYDTSGKVLDSKISFTGLDKAEILTSKLETGTYFVKVSTDSIQRIYRVLILN